MKLGIELEHNEFEAIRKGDARLFESVFRRYYQNLCTYCLGILGDAEKTEDIVQDAFAYLWENRNSIIIQTSLKSYLYTTVRNGALKLLRTKVMEQKHNSKLLEFIEYLEASDDLDEELTHLKLVEDCIDNLPSQCKKVFLMSVLDQKSYKEIAADLNISINTVKAHVTKAYRLVRSKVQIKEPMILYLAVKMLE